MLLQSKLPNVGTTIFTVMSSLAVEHKAINLGQGFPDFMMSEELTGLVNSYMQKGCNQYVHMAGLPLLRERLAEKCNELYNTSINGETQITITPGGTYAIYTAITAVLQKGDEVIVFEPAYDSYIPNIEVNGAKALTISLEFPTYSIPWDKVREKLNDKTRMIIVNSPHNPTGAVLSKNDIEELRKIVADTNIIIISDEVYEHLIFDNLQHESILRYPDLMERSFVCFSFGKTYHCTGWKIGYCISNEALMKEFRKVHQFNCFCCHTPSQVALASFLKNKEAYTSLGAMMQQKRDDFKTLLSSSRFDLLHSSGSYFVTAGYSRISDEGDKEFAIRLTREYGVATIPVSSFYKNGTDNKVIRFCFAKKNETLEAAAERLRRV